MVRRKFKFALVEVVMSYKMRVRAAAILINEDKLLLTEYGGGKYYNFTGGGVEENETVKQAVAREVMEEAGLTVDVEELVFTLEYEPKSCNYYHGSNGCITLFFKCRLNTEIPPQTPTHPDINPDDPSITSVFKWIPLSKLKEINLLPPIYEPLMNYIKTGIFIPSFMETHIFEPLSE